MKNRSLLVFTLLIMIVSAFTLNIQMLTLYLILVEMLTTIYIYRHEIWEWLME